MRQQFMAGLGVGLLLAALLYGVMNEGRTRSQPAHPSPITVSGATSTAASAPRSDLDTKHGGTRPSAPVTRTKTPVAGMKTSVRVVIIPGLSVQAIADQLVRAGVLQSGGAFIAMAKREPFLRAGTYELRRNEPLPELLFVLTAS